MCKSIIKLLPLLVVFSLLSGTAFAKKYPYFTKPSNVKIFPIFEVSIKDKKTPKGRIALAIQTKRKLYLESLLVIKTDEGKLSPYFNHQLPPKGIKKRAFRYAVVLRPNMIYIYEIPAEFSKELKPVLSFAPSIKSLLSIKLSKDLTDTIDSTNTVSFENAAFSLVDVSEFGEEPKIKLGGVTLTQAEMPKATEEPKTTEAAEPAVEPAAEATEEPKTAETTEEPEAEPTAEPAAEPAAEPTAEPAAQ